MGEYDRIIAQKVRERAGEIRRIKERRRKHLMLAVPCMLGMILVVLAAQRSMLTVPDEIHAQAAITASVSGQEGIYVLIGLSGFVLGAVFSLICVKLKRKNEGRH